MKKLIVGISGATGVIYGIRLLEVLTDYRRCGNPSRDESLCKVEY